MVLKKNNNKPLIGLTLDLEKKATYSLFPWYAIRKNYLTAVYKYGGIPIPLAYNTKLIRDYLELLDGIIITGGAFDINPSYFSQKKKYSNLVTKKDRTTFEIDICEKALANNTPILGICGGQQLLNVVYGGTLIQDINSEIETTINHEQKNPRNQTSHNVRVIKNTKLLEIANTNIIKVNSAHHQSVKDLGKGLIKNAEASDGIIEGIEDNSMRFCIGVQWHPEFLIERSDKKLFKRFINICKIIK